MRHNADHRSIHQRIHRSIRRTFPGDGPSGAPLGGDDDRAGCLGPDDGLELEVDGRGASAERLSERRHGDHPPRAEWGPRAWVAGQRTRALARRAWRGLFPHDRSRVVTLTAGSPAERGRRRTSEWSIVLPRGAVSAQPRAPSAGGTPTDDVQVVHPFRGHSAEDDPPAKRASPDALLAARSPEPHGPLLGDPGAHDSGWGDADCVAAAPPPSLMARGAVLYLEPVSRRETLPRLRQGAHSTCTPAYACC
jgi:hypothetical protein